MPVAQRRRKHITASRDVTIRDLISRHNLEAEIYHQARKRGLYLAIRPVLAIHGEGFVPSLAFIDKDLEIYCLGRVLLDQSRKKTAHMSNTNAKSKKYAESGYPWFYICKTSDIPDMLRFVEAANLVRQVGVVREANSGESIGNTGNSKLTKSVGKRKGQGVPVRKGAFVAETGFRGFGKFR